MTAHEQELGLAVRSFLAGEHSEAESLARQVLARDPRSADALSLLGAVAMGAQSHDRAAELFASALRIRPTDAGLSSNLGLAHRRAGRPQQALECFVRALESNPDLVEASYHLGLTLLDLDRTHDAIAHLERAAALKPTAAEVQHALSSAHSRLSDQERRVQHLRRAVELAPELARLRRELAGVLHYLRRFDEAEAVLREMIRDDPRSAELQRALGEVAMEKFDYDQAMAAFQRATELEPDDPGSHAYLSLAQWSVGNYEQSLQSVRRAMQIAHGESRCHSNLVFCLPFHPDYDQAAILAEARRWAEQHTADLPLKREHANDREPERRLRIGYVSPDFIDHCQSNFTLPLLRHHDHAAFEIYCYASVHEPDALTARLRSHADVWRDVARLDDGELADVIERDHIDVLVDLTMHMDGSRLRTFARRPAPVQVAWLAYPGTTGLSAIDYRLSDPYLDPPDADLGVYAERTERLPHTFWCYEPLVDELAPGDPPADRNGYVTFGCLNKVSKLNPSVIALFARVLAAQAGARLLLLAPSGSARSNIRAGFQQLGLDPARIEFVGAQPRRQYMETYRRIDVCLDTLPYNGHTTSLDALWMGVPVVTLVGRTVVGRAGLCQAMNLDLPELVAWTPDEYVQAALRLGHERGRLRELRAGLRQRLRASPLMDGAGFARSVETAYRRMWRASCEMFLSRHTGAHRLGQEGSQ